MGLETQLRTNSDVYQAVGTLRVNGRSTRIRKSLGTKDPNEAHLLCLQLEQKILLGQVSVHQPATKGDVTFGELIRSFKADPSTGNCRTGEQILTKFYDHFSNRTVRDFTKAEVTQYIYEQHTSHGHSANHVRRVIAQIQSLLNYGYEQGFRAERVTLRKPTEEIKDLEVLTSDEERRILHKLNPFNKRLATFILNTGARPIEARQLLRKDVDFPRKECVLTSIKGRARIPRKRTLPLNPKAYAAAHGNQAAPLDQEGDHVFTYIVNGVHQPYDSEAGQTYFLRDWSQACKRSSVEGKSPYAMRHTFGTRLGDANTPFAVISKLMGHTDPKTTMRYVHPSFEDHTNAVMAIL